MADLDRALSVIIPTFNRAALLDRCLASVRGSGLVDVEIVVVDDGGNDATEAVAGSHGATYVRQANAGPATARNTGLARSRGEYVLFLDSDDEWINGGAGRLVSALDANPDVDVVFGDSLMGDAETGFVSFIESYASKPLVDVPADTRPCGTRVFDRQSFFLELSTRNVMFLGSTVFRRRLLADLGGFDPVLFGAEDWDVFMRSTIAGRVGYSPGPAVSRYYKHGYGISANNDRMDADFIRALDSVRRRSPLSATERSHVEARLRAHTFGWAWRAYDRGDLTTTRQRLQWARRLGVLGAREWTYLALTYVPAGVVKALRTTRQGRVR
jgi:glycosyltransferase involved in cell wall biosynthesis